jgi:hypothetical protein
LPFFLPDLSDIKVRIARECKESWDLISKMFDESWGEGVDDGLEVYAREFLGFLE